MIAKLVVDTGYGDAGKGNTVTYLCNKYKANFPIVVRFSGGQQVGHNIVVDGIKHTCSNYGAGILQGVQAYFTEHTCIYPVTMKREADRLMKKMKTALKPGIVAHPMTKVTTPFDVFANRECDKTKADGTCGLGIGKTMKRNEGINKLHVIDLTNEYILKLKMQAIGESYGYYSEDQYEPELRKEIKEFYDALNWIKMTVANYEYLRQFGVLIFEGSQGILLDMDHGVHPHVTYSNTTSKNAHEVLDLLGITNRETFYITRSYSTRHGNGPFKETHLALNNFETEVNKTNRYQHRFKLGHLDYDLLNYAIAVDDIYNKTAKRSLVVTCLDQQEIFHYGLLESRFSTILESRSPGFETFTELKENTWNMKQQQH